MFRSRNATDPEVEVVRPTVTSDPALRDERDPDPAVEEAVERLRRDVSELVAYDEWGRPLAWRHVARIALGPLVSDLRDSQTAARIGQHMVDPAEPTEAKVEESDAPAASVTLPPASVELPPTSIELPSAPTTPPEPPADTQSLGVGWPG